MVDPHEPADAWRRIEGICNKLRGPGGCPWDRSQTPETLAPYLIEEIHETVDALRLGQRSELTDEVGDVLYLWTFFLLALRDAGLVSIGEAAERIETKLVRRHPRVFGSGGSPEGEREPGLWEKTKRLEAGLERDLLQPLPSGMPAMLKAMRLQEKAAAFGFDWGCPADVIPKVREEIEELSAAVRADPRSPEAREELGDLLFAIVNLARHLGQDPEAMLLAATEKFRRRFNSMARSVEAAGFRMGDAPLEILEAHWQAIKPRA